MSDDTNEPEPGCERPPRYYAVPEDDVERAYGDLEDVRGVETATCVGISVWFESADPIFMSFRKGGGENQ